MTRIFQGAPGVICSPAITPSLIQRWSVEGAGPRICGTGYGDELALGCHPIWFAPRDRQWVRRLPTRLVVKRRPVAVYALGG